jgi:hypothetical protein
MEGETKEFLINENMKPIQEDDGTGSEYNELEDSERSTEYNEEEEECEEEECEEGDNIENENTLTVDDLKLQTCRCGDVIIQGLTIVFIMQIATLGFMVFT